MGWILDILPEGSKEQLAFARAFIYYIEEVKPGI